MRSILVVVVVALCVAWTHGRRALLALAWLVVAFLTYLSLAAVQSLCEMARTVHDTLLSAAAAAFYFGRHGQRSPLHTKLLAAGFRVDSMRRIPASAYLHTTYGLDRSIADELGTMVNILVGDFVTHWYKQLTTDELFTSSIKLLLCDLLGGAAARATTHLDLHGALSVLTQMLQVIQLHLAWFREMYTTLAEVHPLVFADDDSQASLEMRRRLVHDAVRTHEKLHPGCLPSAGGGTNVHLKRISTQVLVLLRPDFDDRGPASPTHALPSFASLMWHFGSEIVANCILTPILETCNPIYLNPLVASVVEPLQVRDVELDTKTKHPTASYTASRASRSSSMFDDTQLVNQLVTLMGELSTPMGPGGLDALLPLSPPSTARSSISVTTPTPSTNGSKPKSKLKKQLSILDVSKMKARFTRRRHSLSSDRSDDMFTSILDGCPSEASESEPSIGHEMVHQVDVAIDHFLNLDGLDLMASGRTKELHALVASLEEVLLFGFKQTAVDGSHQKNQSGTLSYWAYVNQRRAQTTFWNDRLELVASLPPPRVSDGHFSARGVQWLLLALEEGELWEYFTAMTLDTVATDVYFEPYAILRDKELSAMLLASLFRLNGLRVSLRLQALGHDRVQPAAPGSALLKAMAKSNPFDVATVVEEAWESERYLPLQGWTKSSDKRRKDDERLPSSEWEWSGPWVLEECPEVEAVVVSEDHDRGWQYSKTTKDLSFHAKESLLDIVRRRKWQRCRQTLPLLLIPHDDASDGPQRSRPSVLCPTNPMSPPSNQDRETAAPAFLNPPPTPKSVSTQLDSHARGPCHLCLRVMVASASHTCPACLHVVCFSCSNHCVALAGAPKQRVCTVCYDQHVEKLRLRLSARATRLPDTAAGPAFFLHVTTFDGQEWKGIKTWTEFEALNATLLDLAHHPHMEGDDVDHGEWLRIAPPPLTPTHETDTDEAMVNRFLVELLKCHTLCQTPVVQQFLLEGAPASLGGDKESKSSQTRLGQVLLQKLEIQCFKAMDELFELDEMNRMRRRLLSATRTFIRVSFNATCHRIVEAQFAEFTHPRKVAALVFDIRSMVIPTDGIYFHETVTPSPTKAHEQAKACRAAFLRACPPALLSVLGEAPTRHGCLKVFEFLQHEILVKNLVLSLLDVLLHKLFPEMTPLGALHGKTKRRA
ncbi:Aste57867_11706 [Aphanomyces stellatus]|uniref:Aste57867_11706 protein n=1 Tax=Aphanomyces stellatus TaxID=120398 RepID=A0A485KU90_9STRA|nr:hypothetical protein As57867_011663 [Aphanomyces stellatus]VFT88563.1 Aste57867_11706 [Aphanomyces stellatus]